MRTELLKKSRSKTRYTYRGTFVRTGKKHGTSGATIILKDVHQKGSSIKTEHLWLNYTKGIARLNMLWPGDIIEFDGAIESYPHGRGNNFYFEYGLARPTNVKLISKRRLPAGVQRIETAWMADKADFNTRILKFAKYLSYLINKKDD